MGHINPLQIVLGATQRGVRALRWVSAATEKWLGGHRELVSKLSQIQSFKVLGEL